MQPLATQHHLPCLRAGEVEGEKPTWQCCWEGPDLSGGGCTCGLSRGQVAEFPLPFPSLPSPGGLLERLSLRRPQPAPALGYHALSAQAGLESSARPLSPQQRPGTGIMPSLCPLETRPTASRTGLCGSQWWGTLVSPGAAGAASRGCWAGKGLTVRPRSLPRHGGAEETLAVSSHPIISLPGRMGCSLGSAARGRWRGQGQLLLRGVLAKLALGEERDD